MPRRAADGLTSPRPSRLVTLAQKGFAAGLVVAAGCQSSDGGTAGCVLAQEVVLPPTPLTLLPDARLDSIGLIGQTGAGFVLSGVDGDGMTVRWAALDATGTAGTEHALTVPASAAGPWLAFAAGAAPGDTLLIARAEAAATATDAELHVIVAPAAGAAATPAAPAPGPALATIGGALAGGAVPDVAFGSSRSGAHAALAWIDPAAGGVEILTLTAAGAPVGAPTLLEKATSLACLAFVPGRDPLTLVYERFPDATSQIPDLIVTDFLEDGSVDTTVDLRLDPHDARCPALTVTPTGYAFAFEDSEGVWLGRYDTDLALTPFAAAVGLGGAALLPPIEGLAPLGTDYGVVFARGYGGELWRLDGQGHRRSGALEFPSMDGHVGTISTRPGTGTMFATYADYTSADAGVGTDGQRYFLGATCL